MEPYVHCAVYIVQCTYKLTNDLFKVSFVLVLIGATPDLEFLKTDSELGQVPGAPIERENPIDIDVYTHQSLNVPGLFAMGPLTGDNFVR